MSERLCRGRVGFTLIELMIVVAIVAILALVVLVPYHGHVLESKMTEGVTGVGMIRTALRSHAGTHNGAYPDLTNATGENLLLLNIKPSDLQGKYFGPADYLVDSSPTEYTVRAMLRDNNAYWYEVNQDGGESRSY